MYRRLTPSQRRAQWFSDLALALAEADRLLVLLEEEGSHRAETARLRLRIQNARSELELLSRAALGE